MIASTIANVVLHVILIASFIVMFFFTYGSKVEGEIVKKQCTAIVDDIMADVGVFLPANVQIPTSGLTAPDMTELDEKVAVANRELMQRTLRLMSIVFVVGFVIIVSMSIAFKFSLKDLLVHNAITLLFVALTEFVFLTFFAKNYITIDASFIKYKALVSLKNALSKQQ